MLPVVWMLQCVYLAVRTVRTMIQHVL